MHAQAAFKSVEKQDWNIPLLFFFAALLCFSSLSSVL